MDLSRAVMWRPAATGFCACHAGGGHGEHPPMRVSPTVLLLAISLFSLTAPGRAEILVKSGEKIAFLGDSITQGGWSNPTGYVRLVMAGLEANGVKAEAIP